MQIPKRQVQARERITKMSNSIRESIDEICKEENYTVTYAEINAALLEVLSSNNSHELRELWKKYNNNDSNEILKIK